MFVCVCVGGVTRKETAKGGGCEAALNQLPLTIPTCCGGRTHRPEPARRGTTEECVCNSAALFINVTLDPIIKQWHTILVTEQRFTQVGKPHMLFKYRPSLRVP